MQTGILSAPAATLRVQIGDESCDSPQRGKAVRCFVAQRMYAVLRAASMALAHFALSARYRSVRLAFGIVF